jgi:hypothetical protein
VNATDLIVFRFLSENVPAFEWRGCGDSTNSLQILSFFLDEAKVPACIYKDKYDMGVFLLREGKFFLKQELTQRHLLQL